MAALQEPKFLVTASDEDILNMLTGPQVKIPPQRKAYARRDAALDPLLLAATFHNALTRNHYNHDVYPGNSWTCSFAENGKQPSQQQHRHLTYVSRQAPRSQRLREAQKENGRKVEQQVAKPSPSAQRKRRLSESTQTVVQSAIQDPTSPALQPPLEVRCMARTRIPTPYCPVFLHLYHNNRDSKEHLAIVIDPAQLNPNPPQPVSAPPIRSKSLDAVWSENETAMDRITRGAYVGALSPTLQQPSVPSSAFANASIQDGIPSPLIRIHSECFTGETVGSMRCDCGEQLDEAMQGITLPGRGVVVYLRQEGRGIGLLSKIRAYNLQDLGHDTVAANLMLGHQADERGYEVACAILRDLGLGGEKMGEGVRVLTNNPDKVRALEAEGLKVVERVPMVPRSWRIRRQAREAGNHTHSPEDVLEGAQRPVGATCIGGNAVYGAELDKYLHTKITKMGHILPGWLESI
ncbi:hypothetical protein FISHEDRAFT_41830 [Fistulina hepatica ATCC 64428]|nr:hypothetical protein FISHEDRAFT_41830 [Fistulina hepatica ATCC 64428]